MEKTIQSAYIQEQMNKAHCTKETYVPEAEYIRKNCTQKCIGLEKCKSKYKDLL